MCVKFKCLTESLIWKWTAILDVGPKLNCCDPVKNYHPAKEVD